MTNEELLVGAVKQSGTAVMLGQDLIHAVRGNGCVLKGASIGAVRTMRERLQQALCLITELESRAAGNAPPKLGD